MSDSSEVRHDPSVSRFVVTLEEGDAFVKYRRAGTALDLYYTYVPEAARGGRIAERLCGAAFEHAKEEGLTVVPSCPYIAQTYLKRHPEYVSLTQPGASS